MSIAKYTNNIDLFLKYRFSKILENLEELLNLREKLGGGLDLIKLVYFVLCVSHFSACGWYLIGNTDSNYTWIAKN